MKCFSNSMIRCEFIKILLFDLPFPFQAIIQKWIIVICSTWALQTQTTRNLLLHLFNISQFAICRKVIIISLQVVQLNRTIHSIPGHERKQTIDCMSLPTKPAAPRTGRIWREKSTEPIIIRINPIIQRWNHTLVGTTHRGGWQWTKTQCRQGAIAKTFPGPFCYINHWPLTQIHSDGYGVAAWALDGKVTVFVPLYRRVDVW